jgi:hypothetical protein
VILYKFIILQVMNFIAIYVLGNYNNYHEKSNIWLVAGKLLPLKICGLMAKITILIREKHTIAMPDPNLIFETFLYLHVCH